MGGCAPGTEATHGVALPGFLGVAQTKRPPRRAAFSCVWRREGEVLIRRPHSLTARETQTGRVSFVVFRHCSLDRGEWARFR